MNPLLAGIKTGPELMAMTFTIEDVLAELTHLVDSGACTPNCLFGTEATEPACSCRCGCTYHGQARYWG